MSCAIWEERVALFAGGDLAAAGVAAVERHVSECAACRALAEDLRVGLDGLREAHAEPLAAAHYAAVRARVLAELAKPPRRSAAWAWAALAAVAVTAAAALVVTMRPAAIPTPDLPRVVARTPMVERPAPRERGGSRSPGRHGRLAEAARLTGGSACPTSQPKQEGGTGAFACQPLPSHLLTAAEPAVLPTPTQALATAEPATPEMPAAPEAPLHMVQLATDDPNVVIYWLLEETGEER